jgi:hypothetical protein
MKKVLVLFSILISTTFSQKSVDYIKFVEQIKRSKIDSNDKTVYKLLMIFTIKRYNLTKEN